MFLGRFKTDFNGKNRLTLPKRFRKELGGEDKFYIYLGQNGEIWGFDLVNWSKLTESILELPLSTDQGRLNRLKFFPKTEECLLDAQGRFILPQEFADNLDSKQGVYILGAGDHFEIWNQSKWEEYIIKVEKDFR